MDQRPKFHTNITSRGLLLKVWAHSARISMSGGEIQLFMWFCRNKNADDKRSCFYILLVPFLSNLAGGIQWKEWVDEAKEKLPIAHSRWSEHCCLWPLLCHILPSCGFF